MLASNISPLWLAQFTTPPNENNTSSATCTLIWELARKPADSLLIMSAISFAVSELIRQTYALSFLTFQPGGHSVRFSKVFYFLFVVFVGQIHPSVSLCLFIKSVTKENINVNKSLLLFIDLKKSDLKMFWKLKSDIKINNTVLMQIYYKIRFHFKNLQRSESKKISYTIIIISKSQPLHNKDISYAYV